MIQRRIATKAFSIEMGREFLHCGFPILWWIMFWQQLLDGSIEFFGFHQMSTEKARNRDSRTYTARQYFVLNAFESVVRYKLKYQSNNKKFVLSLIQAMWKFRLSFRFLFIKLKLWK